MHGTADEGEGMKKIHKLPPLAIPTDACYHAGHNIFRHLPKIREGRLKDYDAH